MSLRIMIVEDEPIVAMYIETILTDAGHAVVGVATSMRSALALADDHPNLDLAIMDVDLAGRPDGVETAKRLRETRDLASLFVSVRVGDEVRARAAECRPVGFVAKPFNELDLLEAISGLARRKSSPN